MKGAPEKACWKTFGKVMNIRDGALSRLTPTEKATGNLIRPAIIATIVSMPTIWTADFNKLSMPVEVRGIGTKASYA